MEKPPAGQRDLLREMLLSSPCAFGNNAARDLLAVPEAVKADPLTMHGFSDEYRLPLQGAQLGATRSQALSRIGDPAGKPLTLAVLHAAEQQGYADATNAWQPGGANQTYDFTFDPTIFKEGEGKLLLIDGLEAIYTAAGTQAPPQDDLLDQVASLPAPVAAAAGHLLKASAQASTLRNQALEGAANITPTYGQFINDLYYRIPEVLFATKSMPADHWFRSPAVMGFLSRHYKHDLMLQAALTITSAIDQIDWTPLADTTGFYLDLVTPMGRLIIADSADDHHQPTGADHNSGNGAGILKPEGEEEAILLLIDTGGDDLYEIPVGATMSISNPISIAIDLGGHDTYSYQAPTDTGTNTAPTSPTLNAPAHVNTGTGATAPPTTTTTETARPSSIAPVAPVSLLTPDAAGRYPASSSSSSAPPDSDQLVPLGQGPNQSSSQVGRQGSGRLGIGIIADYGAGDDWYGSLRMSQGFGILGVGILLDDGGDDRYASESFSQGSALFGTGLLLDLAGQDELLAWHGCQGYGGTLGFGAVVNLGDSPDTYHAVAGDENAAPSAGPTTPPSSAPATGRDTVIFPWSENQALNRNLCQGAAAGVPPFNIYTEGIMSGGLGLLVDGGGDDYYRAGVGAQGRAEWAGRGNLVDHGGNDRYDSSALAQASADNYSLAVLLDYDGNDQFNVTVNRLHHSHLASAGEFSAAVVYNISGSDRYVANARAASFSRYNSISLFIDTDGADTYEMGDSTTLGMAMSHQDYTRKQYLTRALFIDGGGVDRYYRPDMVNNDDASPAAPAIGNNSIWEQNFSNSYYGERGNAMDTEGYTLYPRLRPAP